MPPQGAIPPIAPEKLTRNRGRRRSGRGGGLQLPAQSHDRHRLPGAYRGGDPGGTGPGAAGGGGKGEVLAPRLKRGFS